jgi:hypothetical protein
MSEILTPADRALFNDAFLGYKLAEGELYIRVCSECPGKHLVEAWAQEEPSVPLTHGLCPKHVQAYMATLLGEKDCPATEEKVLT